MESIKNNWGTETTCVNTKLYSSKLFVIKEGHSTDKIMMRKQDKTIFILQGAVQIIVEHTSKMLNEGDSYHLPPNIIHQLTAIKGDATIMEVGTSFNSADVVKIGV